LDLSRKRNNQPDRPFNLHVIFVACQQLVPFQVSLTAEQKQKDERGERSFGGRRTIFLCRARCIAAATRRDAARRDADAMRRIAVSSLGAENAVSKTRYRGKRKRDRKCTEGEASGVNGTGEAEARTKMAGRVKIHSVPTIEFIQSPIYSRSLISYFYLRLT